MGVFHFLSILSPLLPILFFILFRPGRGAKELWVVFFYVIFSLLVDSTVALLSTKKDDHPAFILLFTLIDYIFVYSILRLLLQTRLIKNILNITSLLFVIYIGLLYFIGNVHSYSKSLPLESIIVLIFCILYLFEQLNKPEEPFIYSFPGFWIILAFLVYTSGTLFLYIVRTIDFHEADKWWVIHNVCNIVTNCLIALAFFIHYRNSKSKNPSKKIPQFGN
jgi:hypothetical protein